MNSFTLLCMMAVIGMAAVRASPAGGTYTDKYDNINLDEILANRRLLIPYLKCMLDQGKCSPEGKELKNNIRDALETECTKCTPTQQKGSRRVIGYIINNEPEYWSQLTAKYDPKHQYAKKYEDELRTVKAN